MNYLINIKQRASLNSQAHTLKPIIKSGRIASTTKQRPSSTWCSWSDQRLLSLIENIHE